jgi:anti-sigma factor RsiW
MSTTTHAFAPEEIMAFVDGELSADRAQSPSAHFDQCSECQQVAETIRSTSQKTAIMIVFARNPQ